MTHEHIDVHILRTVPRELERLSSPVSALLNLKPRLLSKANGLDGSYFWSAILRRQLGTYLDRKHQGYKVNKKNESELQSRSVYLCYGFLLVFPFGKKSKDKHAFCAASRFMTHICYSAESPT